MIKSVWISGATVSDMYVLGRESFPFETGGMLLGYEADNGDAVVRAIIGPGPRARHLRHRFIPDADYQQVELSAHHLHTKGVETYLGDWHTHPVGTTDLSATDKKTLARIATTSSSGITRPIMAIFGGGPDEWNIGAVQFVSVAKRWFLPRYELQELRVEIY